MQTQRGQYNNILANETYVVAVVKTTILHDIWLVDQLANLHKASFILYFPNQNIFNHLKTFKGQDNPKMITTTQILG
jgi:hypothetical protein